MKVEMERMRGGIIVVGRVGREGDTNKKEKGELTYTKDVWENHREIYHFISYLSVYYFILLS